MVVDSVVKDRPILFSAPMVRALLDGSKTQTRRIMKVPHTNDAGKKVLESPIDGSTWGRYRDEAGYWELWGPMDREHRGLLYEWGFKCSYGKPGDQY